MTVTVSGLVILASFLKVNFSFPFVMVGFSVRRLPAGGSPSIEASPPSTIRADRSTVPLAPFLARPLAVLSP